MWYLKGKTYKTTNNVSWWEPHEVDYHPDGITVTLEIGDVSKEPYHTKEVAISVADLVSEHMRFSNVKWIVPGIRTWVFDLDAMKKVFPQLASLHWLTGMLAMDPEINMQPPSRGGFYHAEAKFYLSPSEVGEKRLYSYTPDSIRSSLAAFLQEYPDPTKVAFLMMEFTDTPAHRNIVTAIKTSMDSFGIVAIRADERRFNDSLFPNVLTYIHGCGLGVAVFERITSERFNPNIALEVGYMLAMRKPVCILKDNTLPNLQTDLLDRIYETFDPQNPQETIPSKVEIWLKDKGFIDNDVSK